MSRWMLYGANGYTGKLIAERAVAAGERPILAGRRAEAIEPMAGELGLDHAVFDLDEPRAVAAQLEGIDALLLCAGPFSRTSAPALEACLESGTHYLDITGEIPIFERCHAAGERARAAGVAVLPGAGFDVVPTDCLAATLAAELPGATELELAFHGGGGPSAGTARTMLEGLSQGDGGAIRRGGRITSVPVAYRKTEIPFRDRRRSAVSIPWGDVSTAYYSTGIENIVVYMAMPPRTIRMLELGRPLRGLLASRSVRWALEKLIDRRVTGPTAEERASRQAQLWGRVQDGSGNRVEATLVTPEGYSLTAATALESVRRAAAGDIEPGAHTPATAFGAGYIEEFDGCEMRIESRAAA